ncbi:MAG: DUF1631 family protein [Porticoccaceae bacterium]
MIEQTRTSALPGMLRMLADRHRSFLADGLEAVFARVNEAFFDAADSSSDVALQTVYFDAMKMLRAQRSQIQADIVDQVAEAFFTLTVSVEQEGNKYFASGTKISSLGAAEAEPQSDPGGDVSLDSLALVENDELEAIIIMDTMVSVSRASVHSVLRQLNGRLTTILARVPDAALSPFEPEYLVNSFDTRSRKVDVGLLPRISLLKLFEQVVLAGLPTFLDECDVLLADLGVKPTFTDTSAEDTPVEDALVDDNRLDKHLDEKPSSELEAPTTTETETAQSILGRASARLLEALPESVKAQVAEASPDIEYPPLSVAVTTLLQLGDVTAANTERRSIREQIDEALASQGQDFEQLHPVDRHIVGLMDALFEQVGKRRWSPDVLNGLLGKVELPAVNLAISDPGFLDREYHPARRLLNEIAAVASSFQLGSTPAADPLYQKIDGVINRLRSLQYDARSLTDLLSEFIELAEKDRRRCARLGSRTMEEAIATERTNSAYEQVEKILKSRVCGAGQPLFVLDLVEQAWCKVLFLAHVKHGVDSPEWHTGVHLLDQLVGLVADPDSVEAAYVEKLLVALAAALERIAYDSFESSRLLRLIADFFATDHVGSSLIVLEKDEARDAGQYFVRVITDTLQLSIPGESHPMDEGLVAQLVDSDLSRVDSIARDSWVEFRSITGDPICGRLLGVVPSSNTFVFGDRAGNKVAEAHRYRLAVAMKEGNLVVLDNSHLFDEALTEAFDVMRQKAANEN